MSQSNHSRARLSSKWIQFEKHWKMPYFLFFFLPSLFVTRPWFISLFIRWVGRWNIGTICSNNEHMIHIFYFFVARHSNKVSIWTIAMTTIKTLSAAIASSGDIIVLCAFFFSSVYFVHCEFGHNSGIVWKSCGSTRIRK